MNTSGESGHPRLVPDLRGEAFNLSLLSIMLAVGLSYMAFMLMYCPSIPNLLRAIIINGYLILLNTFSASIEMIT